MLCFPFLFFFLHTRGWKSKHAHEAPQSSAGDCLDLEFMKKSWTFKYTESVSTVPVILLFLLVKKTPEKWNYYMIQLLLFFFFLDLKWTISFCAVDYACGDKDSHELGEPVLYKPRERSSS